MAYLKCNRAWISFSITFVMLGSALASCNASAVDSGSGLAADQVNVAIQFTALVDSLQKLRISPCVPRVSKNHVNVLQQVSVEAFEMFNRKYSAYTTSITRPMSGNGRCDGGFNSVASESQKRAQETSDFEDQVYKIQTYFVDNFRGHYVEAPIYISDESDDLKCEDESAEAFDQGLQSGLNAKDGIRNLRKDLIRTELMFRKYASQNATLGSNCGEIPGDMTSMIMGQGGMLQPKMLGAKFDKSESTVTGQINNQDFSSSNSIQVSRPEFGEPSASNPSQVTGGGAQGSAGSDGSAKQRRALHKILSEFGNPLVTANGKQGNANSEEFAVSNLLKAGEGGADGRAPAAANGSTNVYNKSILESALEAKGSTDRAARAAEEAEKAAQEAALQAKKALKAEQARFSASLGKADVALFERIHAKLRPRKK